MKLYPSILALVFITITYSCHPNQPGEKKSPVALDSPVSKKSVKTDTITAKAVTKILRDSSIQNISIGKGFSIKLINYDKPTYYQYMEIEHNDRKIFSDTSNEYVFDDRLYPLLNQVDSNKFELLLKQDNRPSQDLGILFTIVNDKIIKKDSLPDFFGKKDIANNEPEYYGYWDYSEEWGTEDKMYTTYNPILYYKVTNEGIKLDSTLTIKENQKMYGRFYGFECSEKIGFPVNGRGKIDTIAKHAVKYVLKKKN